MTSQLPDCTSCSIKMRCLPSKLGLTALSRDELPREVINRKAGELIFDKSGSGDMAVIRHGWTARYVMFHDGRRQITDLLLPGDFAGNNQAMPPHEALQMVALSDAQTCLFDGSTLLVKMSARHDHLLELIQVSNAKTMRLWQLLAAMGRQSGPSRMAAFFVALHARLGEIGDATETEMPYHLRQQDLADILGMTQVHVSRTMRDLQQANILRIEGRTATVLDREKLERLGRA